MRMHHVLCGPSVDGSERTAFERIKAHLKTKPGGGEWILLGNLTSSECRRRQSDEIEIVTIGPPEVQIIEAKRWSAAWVNQNPQTVEKDAGCAIGKMCRIDAGQRRRVNNLPEVGAEFLVTETSVKVEAPTRRETVRGILSRTFRIWQDDRAQARELGLNSTGVEREEYPTLASILDQAANPASQKRIASTANALSVSSVPNHVESVVGQSEATLQSDANPEPTEQSGSNMVWPMSLWSNGETRGLDTEFAKNTRIGTSLKQTPFHATVNRCFELAALCRYAEDGKTALLQRFVKLLGLYVHGSATPISKGRLKNGLNLRPNRDGSAPWRGRPANDLLNASLEPFQIGHPASDFVRVTAIYDGQLLDWIEKAEEWRGESSLSANLFERFEDTAEVSGNQILFFSLKPHLPVDSVATDDRTIEAGFPERLADIFHVAQHPGSAADTAFDPDAAREAWSGKRRHVQCHDPKGVGRVVHALRKGTGADVIRRETARLLSNRHWMGYAEATDEGHPIGSGAVESAKGIPVSARRSRSELGRGRRDALALWSPDRSRGFSRAWVAPVPRLSRSARPTPPRSANDGLPVAEPSPAA